jgi:enoyl-CoA hydratase
MSEVRLDRKGTVALVSLDAPARRNALNAAMAKELVQVCETIDADTSIGAVVLRGESPAFCSGADRQLLRMAAVRPSSTEGIDALSAIYEAFARVGTLQPPVIAAV